MKILRICRRLAFLVFKLNTNTFHWQYLLGVTTEKLNSLKNLIRKKDEKLFIDFNDLCREFRNYKKSI